jgi:hypothetical protein
VSANVQAILEGILTCCRFPQDSEFDALSPSSLPQLLASGGIRSSGGGGGGAVFGKAVLNSTDARAGRSLLALSPGCLQVPQAAKDERAEVRGGRLCSVFRRTHRRSGCCNDCAA